MNKTLIILTILSCSLAACVTINIYFPAAATEKAADKIIDEVWQIQKPDQPKPEQQKNSDDKPAENKTQKETK